MNAAGALPSLVSDDAAAVDDARAQGWQRLLGWLRRAGQFFFALSFSSLSGAYYPGSGTTVYVDGGNTGGLTVTPSSSDADSGVSGYTYPALGTGWSNTNGAYTFDATAGTIGAFGSSASRARSRPRRQSRML